MYNTWCINLLNMGHQFLMPHKIGCLVGRVVSLVSPWAVAAEDGSGAIGASDQMQLMLLVA